jgi:methionine aminotransferase
MQFDGVIKSKLSGVGTSIFSVMSQLAAEHDAINLAQGFPNFMCSKDLISLVNKFMNKGYNQYAPMPGLLSLREQIAIKTEKLYTAQYDPETEITITPGGTLAIYAAIEALVIPGDEVIIIEPCYDSYTPSVRLAGGVAKYARLQYPKYTIDWNDVKKLVTFKTKLIIINTPHNPTGSILSASDMQKLEKIVDNTDIIVISDEVYEHIIFDGLEHQSVCRFPKLAKHSVVISSFGKTYHTTGWKLGYFLAPENITREIRKAYQFMAFAANTPIQHALAEFIKREDEYNNLPAFYQEKRDYFRKLLKGSKFKLLNCSGSYFQSVAYDKISDMGDVEFAKKLTKENKVATIPTSVFYHNAADNKVLRLCFAKDNETLEMAAEKLMEV